jgi:hypothetical protein
MERNNIVCSHTDLSDIGTNTHSMIDAHINTQEIHQPGGATAFTELSDVPQSYTDQAGKMLVVNEGETALEFTDVPISNILNFHTQTDLICNFASYNYIIATIDESLSISISNVTTGIIYGIMINNDSESEITITLPNTADVKSSTTTTIAAGKYKELAFFSDGTTRYWQISEELS